MEILVINSGSSSIKFKFFDMDNKSCLASGVIEEIGSEHSKASIATTIFHTDITEHIKTHEEGIEVMYRLLKDSSVLKDINDIEGIGHRIVQGADYFDKAVLVDDDVLNKIEELCPLAPLHNPANLAGIKSCISAAKTPNVAVFDTTFHQSMPRHAYMYALPYEFYEKNKVRRYGAHGTSHWFVSRTAAEFLGIDYEKFNAITLHLGNGSSITAIKNGKCIDTSMGMTPLEGLMMGTRCGSIDPAIIPYMERAAGYGAQEMDTIMNKKSGLFGICGTNDLRKVEELMEAGDEKAKLAYDMLVYQIVKLVGAYYAALGKIDAIVFTGGIGENANILREKVCDKLAHFGIKIDKAKNSVRRKINRDLSTADASIKTLIIPTNEELAIAELTVEVLKSKNLI
ncbi:MULTISPECIES: acetate kinase [unclassified Campylobacter]|uniref:acetate kinase n=1 Tax=unclassified Campylobacter TaxID=2593542 RepID=UPI0022E9DD8E|nr:MULTISPECIES: acetate kinase [unclassified Campylobacter]MDA3079959.1 acetate kinase [Campylobacter sp. CS_NA2]MDA3081281.1 acetate kinase [Campylobacter sp. CS_NA1]MDA3086059.1 acetate kinase [Campylobacter sp. CS_ED1]MDA3090792.1 acetate kinase [Campylobacter sp. CS_ED2]WBR51921.1 acetate kinase [Campylobacter sp. CS_NA3]